MTNRAAILSIAEETNKKNGKTEYVAILKEPHVVQNFRSPDRDEALRLAREHAISRDLTVIEMSNVVKAT